MAGKKQNRPIKVSKSIPLDQAVIDWYEKQAQIQDVPTAQLMRSVLNEYKNENNNFLDK